VEFIVDDFLLSATMAFNKKYAGLPDLVSSLHFDSGFIVLTNPRTLPQISTKPLI